MESTPASDQVVPVLVAGALPLGHPVAGECEPVRADAEADGWLSRPARLGFAHGIEVGNGLRSVFGGLVDDVARALVGGEVVEGAPVGSLADAGFLGAVAPLDHVVAGAETAHGAEVVGVGLAGVAGVRFGQTEEIGAATAKVAVPEPERRAEFGIVPGVAAPVVVPDVARRGVGVHEVAILPEAVPGTVVDLALVVGEHGVESVFDGFLERSGAVGQTPRAEDAGGVDVLRRRGEQRKLRCRRPPWRPYPASLGRPRRRRGSVRWCGRRRMRCRGRVARLRMRRRARGRGCRRSACPSRARRATRAMPRVLPWGWPRSESRARRGTTARSS